MSTPIGRIEQPNLFPELLPTVNTARPEFIWMIPHAEAMAIPSGTLVYLEEDAGMAKLYHAALQKIGHTLKLPAGSDLTADTCIAIRILQANAMGQEAKNVLLSMEVASLREGRNKLDKYINDFLGLPWYKRVWLALFYRSV